ncbi:MAG: FIST N-terminal domain-containing protein, partial [Planctomycetota bacterium]
QRGPNRKKGERLPNPAELAASRKVKWTKTAVDIHGRTVKMKVVIVFGIDNLNHEQLLEGVTSVFDASIVHGCTSYNSITQEGNCGTAAVLAIGGGVEVTAVVADVKGGDYGACGTDIGEQLKDAAGCDAPGKVVALFGDCHVAKNNDVVKGICGVLGERFPVVGAAAKKDISYFCGKVAGKKKNVALLLTGDFEIGCSTLNEGPPDVDPNKLVAAAGQAFKDAVGGDLDRTVMVFAFDCGGRRGKMGKDRPRELGVMQAVVGKEMPVFGFYGSGEMGPKATGDAPKGVGYHISACAIKTQ